MQFKQRRFLSIITAILLALSFISLTTRPALAHTRVEVGPYVLIIGWLNEPPIVGERNALVIEVTENGDPVDGLEATLDLQVLYAGRTFIGNLSPTETAGFYQVEIYPTVRGQYRIQLTGSIGDLAIDELVEPEEILSPRVLQFPEAQPEPLDLQNTIDDLETQLQTAYTLAIVGIVLGSLGLGGAVFSLLRRKK